MKHSALVLLLAASVSCFAQNSGKPAISSNAAQAADLEHMLPQSTQAGCPVMLTSASVIPKGRYMLVRSGHRTPANAELNLGFRNMSGKQIRSIGLAAELRAKRNRYDLDATTVDVHLTISDLIEQEKADLSRTLVLTVEAFGLEQIRLEQVSYADGSIWLANHKNNCSFADQNATLLTLLK